MQKYSFAQFASGLANYTPAPGQYTNTEYFGSPTAAKSLVNSNKGLLSLGGFGGSVTLHFSQGIKNDHLNPYGVDFVIYGNSTQNWAEPGIVQVMKDENKNGMPDDTWYEIAGSDHYFKSTYFNYNVEYKNNGLAKAGNIAWTDSKGNSGIIPENSFHKQAYYPTALLFPNIPIDKFSLEGTRLNCKVDLSNPAEVKIKRRGFGYADNTPVISTTNKMPDNPYSSDIEGSGGDAFDIDWAVDKNMQHVKLDEIHFIRVYTAMNDLAGWLGEVSTEIAGIRDVEPSAMQGILSMIVIEDVKSKMKVGEKAELNAIVFEKGQIIYENVVWQISNPEIAVIENKSLNIKKAGKFKVKASRATNPLIYTELEFDAFSDVKASISITSNKIMLNDKMLLSAKITDQNGSQLSSFTPVWRLKNSNIAEILNIDGSFYLKANKIGSSWLILETIEDKTIKDSINIEILPESISKKVFIAVKTSEKTLIPRQSFVVKQTDLTPFVDKNQKKYGITEESFVSLAHAVYTVFDKPETKNSWAFKDDSEGNNSLYLWKVPEIDEGSVLNIFGYGGSRNAVFNKKTWIVIHNNNHYANGFENIKLNNNDEILIYHIPDNSIEWSITQLITGNDSSKLSNSINAECRIVNCFMNEQKDVLVKTIVGIINQNVTLKLLVSPFTEKNLKTDELGKISFSIDKLGEYEIISGIDKAKLFVGNLTNLGGLNNQSLKVEIRPNPAKYHIEINSHSNIEIINIYDLNGKLMLKTNKNFESIDISNLNSGIYIVEVKAGEQIYRQKLVKTLL